MTVKELGRWVLVPFLAGAIVSANTDVGALPFSGVERLAAVFLLDGQAYFGHLEDLPWSDTLVLRDVYYFEDARKASTGMPVALVKRGREIHQPVDTMRIRRDKVLGIERISQTSVVSRAVAAERALERAR
ncbi:MAG TPA: hypothetical protein VFM93_07835 [Candidatus Limnocylindria bacterium]|nr:hypothetical protein [Candidatus Limnocylindria bacterium]